MFEGKNILLIGLGVAALFGAGLVLWQTVGGGKAGKPLPQPPGLPPPTGAPVVTNLGVAYYAMPATALE